MKYILTTIFIFLCSTVSAQQFRVISESQHPLRHKVDRIQDIETTYLKVDATNGPVTNDLEIQMTTGADLVVSGTAANSQSGVRLKNDAQEWRFSISDQDFFQIRDVTNGKNPFVIDAGSPAGVFRMNSGQFLMNNSQSSLDVLIRTTGVKEAILVNGDDDLMKMKIPLQLETITNVDNLFEIGSNVNPSADLTKNLGGETRRFGRVYAGEFYLGADTYIKANGSSVSIIVNGVTAAIFNASLEKIVGPDSEDIVGPDSEILVAGGS